VILFRCGLEDDDWEWFLELLEELNALLLAASDDNSLSKGIACVAAQKVIGPLLKQKLYQRNVLPIERLGITYVHAFAAVADCPLLSSLEEWDLAMRRYKQQQQQQQQNVVAAPSGAVAVSLFGKLIGRIQGVEVLRMLPSTSPRADGRRREREPGGQPSCRACP
jgi:hypothetical protein